MASLIMHRLFFVAAVIAGVSSCEPAHAQQWQELGPAGGSLDIIAIAPTGGGPMYALQGRRVFASADEGASWGELATPPGCAEVSSPLALQVRSDGDVFINCNGRNMHSRDRAHRWSLVGAPGANIVDGALVFDPRAPQRAAVHRWMNSTVRVAFTADDGLTFSAPVPGGDEPVPALLAWDPAEAGRLVAAGTEVSPAQHPEYEVSYFESRDNGAHWSWLAGIVPRRSDSGCGGNQLLFDVAGRIYLLSGCGIFRSLDAGRTWDAAAGVAGSLLSRLSADPADANRMLSLSSSGVIHESRDAAASWQPLPTPPSPVQTFVADARGRLFAGTRLGIFRLDAAALQWETRNGGLHAQPLRTVEPAGGSNLILSGIGAYDAGSYRSLDGGQTWTSLPFGDQTASEITRNPSMPASVVALTTGNAIFASADGGAVWTSVNASASTGPGERVVGITPIGMQPGIVYGLWQTCDVSAFGGCFWQAHGVARSSDGGASWTRTGSVLGAGYIDRVVVSPADSGTAMVETDSGLWVTRNGGASWEKRRDTYARVTPDPVDPARWYAVDMGQAVIVTTDSGVQWSKLAARPVFSRMFDLLVDPHDTHQLYAVGTFGDVGRSSDRGATWRIVVAPSSTLLLERASARVGPEPSTTLYAAAAQGALRIGIAARDGPALRQAIEFYRPDADHYFISDDPVEIARLDSGMLAGWSRTGFGFNVLVGTAPGLPDVSPVCRFYGKPESGLDSHFYSASPAECQSVRDRFARDWIYESPAVFSMYLPTASDGICPNRTTPVYRLYNNRRDANHRYTMWPELRQRMIADGWIPEGYGSYGVAMCAPW